jgi:hypothetical protein
VEIVSTLGWTREFDPCDDDSAVTVDDSGRTTFTDPGGSPVLRLAGIRLNPVLALVIAVALGVVGFVSDHLALVAAGGLMFLISLVNAAGRHHERGDSDNTAGRRR